MPLPIVENPTYELVIPSTKKVIQYRPFLVKEEKMLLIAQESGEQKQMLNAMKELVKACCADVRVESLTLFDLEFIFLKLREKSVGERAKIQPKCSACENPDEVEVDLASVEVEFPNPEPESTIKLNNEISVDLRHIQVRHLNRFSGKEANKVDESFEFVVSAIKTIHDSVNSYPADEATPKELNVFVESLSHEQFMKITDFLDKAPRIRKGIEWKCSKCGKDNKLTLEGPEAFFS